LGSLKSPQLVTGYGLFVVYYRPVMGITLGYEAFRWTPGGVMGVMVGLIDLPGGDFNNTAYAISADRSVVVGFGTSASGYEAFIWDETNGMQNLQNYLVSLGLGDELTGWTLRSAYGISADGLTIIGYGINPDGNYEAWRAVVPVQASLLLLGTCLLGLAGLGWRRKKS
jgi:probable HAF family extracellular repeat protein